MKKRLLSFVSSLLIVYSAFSQNISVSSFNLLETDLTANTAGTMETDQNGETAALIKVVTTQTGFTFDGGALGIVKTKQTPGEVWVYIPRGSKKISIKHPQLGVLRDYYFPIAIEAARTYEMILTSGTVQTIVKQDAGGQYLVMHVSPSSALVYIDDVEITLLDGVISKFMSYGKHDYRITDPLFKSEAGTFEIGQEKKEINIKLQPSYGQFEITTSPESGAEVYIDDEINPLGTTPFTTRPIKKGDHRFRIQKTDYETKTINHIVHDDGSTLPLKISLNPNYAIVKINIPDGCSLYINKEFKGVGSWQGRLSEGLYHIEASKQGHTPSSQTVNVKRGQEIDVNIQAPTPIYGSLNINCLPVGSKVYIDGIFMGESPCILSKVLIGVHILSIENDGYSQIKKKINVEESKIILIDEQLNRNSIIEIPDSEVKELCLNNWDFNKDGDFSVEEAQKVQRLNGTFKYNSKIRNLDVLKFFTGIDVIEKGEFYNCRNLESITLPESIEEIGDSAFVKCRVLKEFDYSNSIVKLGLGIFYDCDKLMINRVLGLFQQVIMNTHATNEERIQLMRQVISISETNDMGSTDVLELFKQVLTLPQPDAEIALLYASYMNAKNMSHDSISPILEQILKAQPDNASARLQLVGFAWDERNMERVITLCKEARQYNPDEIAFYFYEGMAYYQKDEKDEALNAFQNGIGVINENSNPNIVSDFYAVMGDLLHQKGMVEEAFAAYDSCLVWKGDNIMCLNNYAYYLSERGERLTQAEEMSFKTVKADPKNVTYLDTYAWILFMQGRYTEAKVYIDQALQHIDEPKENAFIIEHAGDIYAQNNDIKRALSFWQEALSIMPEKTLLANKIKYKKYLKE